MAGSFSDTISSASDQSLSFQCNNRLSAEETLEETAPEVGEALFSQIILASAVQSLRKMLRRLKQRQCACELTGCVPSTVGLARATSSASSPHKWLPFT